MKLEIEADNETCEIQTKAECKIEANTGAQLN